MLRARPEGTVFRGRRSDAVEPRVLFLERAGRAGLCAVHRFYFAVLAPAQDRTVTLAGKCDPAAGIADRLRVRPGALYVDRRDEFSELAYRLQIDPREEGRKPFRGEEQSGAQPDE